MITGLPFAPPMLDRGSIPSSGILTLTENFYKPYGEDGRSRIKATFSSVVSSGVIDRLYYEIYEYEDTFADNVIEFLAIPSGMESIEIAGTKYYYSTSSVSGINTITNGLNIHETAYNTYAAMSGSKIEGQPYSSNVVPNLLASGLIAENPLYVQAIPSGLSGNALTIIPDSNSTSIVVRNKAFTKGKDFEFKDPYLEGYVLCSGNLNADYYLPDVPVSDYGVRYMVKMWFANASGVQAVDSNWNPVIYTQVTSRIYGQTYLPYFVEVSGLTCLDLIGDQMPANNLIHLSWDDMTLYSGLTAYRLSQNNLDYGYTYNCTTEDLAQDLVYIIVGYISSSAPTTQPRPIGSWYPLGFTTKNYATIQYDLTNTYSTRYISFWIGLGNSKTKNNLSWLWARKFYGNAMVLID